MTNGNKEVLFEERRGLGWICLNRPRALNALNHEMVARIDARLAEWAGDSRIAGVVISGAGDRGLCAGGDIVSMYHDARSGRGDTPLFWRDEYELNARISEYPKPYLAVMSGLVMGGGVGLSAHGSIRVVTDTTEIAMPEVRIGLSPDVGGTWLLSRAPGELGTHLALTGDRIGPADALLCSLADRYVPDEQLADLLDGLSSDTIGQFGSAAHEPPPGHLARDREWIDACYRFDSVPEIVAALRERPEAAAHAAADRIESVSPSAVAVTLRAMRNARAMSSLRETLAQDLRVSMGAYRSHDFVEGIRAQVIDKDRQPRWSPSSLAEVTTDLVDGYFVE